MYCRKWDTQCVHYSRVFINININFNINMTCVHYSGVSINININMTVAANDSILVQPTIQPTAVLVLVLVVTANGSRARVGHQVLSFNIEL